MNTPRTNREIRTATLISGRSGLLRSEYEGDRIEYIKPEFARQLELELDKITKYLSIPCCVYCTNNMWRIIENGKLVCHFCGQTKKEF